MITSDSIINQLIIDHKISRVVLDNLKEATKELSEFGLALIKGGYISREKMGKLIANSYQSTYVELSKTTYDKNLLKTVSQKMAEELNFLPLYELNGTITIATSTPQDKQKNESIAFIFNQPCSFVYSFPDEIAKQQALFYKSLDNPDKKDYADILKKFNKTTKISKEDVNKLLNEQAIIQILDTLFHYALRERASDIHIEPHRLHLSIRFRIDGKLQNVMNMPIELHEAVVNRLKILSNLSTVEKRLPLDGKFTLTIADQTIDIRISTVATIFGEKVVLRILALDIFHEKPNLFELGITSSILEDIQKALKKSNGMLFVTGPTGAGKTTTLYAIIDYLKNPGINIVTIEDPVEYEIPGITQIEVNTKVGRDFSVILRSVLRQDPDVILVGEIRDLETARIAATAALTGQTVLTTLHTNNAVQAITRMTDMGVQNFVVAPSIIGIINQRLVRLICTACRYSYEPDQNELSLFYRKNPTKIPTLNRGKGCDVCNFTGYKGRIPILEFIKISPRLRNAILHSEPHDALFQIAKEEGYKDLRFDGFIKVLQGLTTIEEVLRVSSSADSEINQFDMKPASESNEPPP